MTEQTKWFEHKNVEFPIYEFDWNLSDIFGKMQLIVSSMFTNFECDEIRVVVEAVDSEFLSDTDKLSIVSDISDERMQLILSVYDEITEVSNTALSETLQSRISAYCVGYNRD